SEVGEEVARCDALALRAREAVLVVRTDEIDIRRGAIVHELGDAFNAGTRFEAAEVVSGDAERAGSARVSLVVREVDCLRVAPGGRLLEGGGKREACLDVMRRRRHDRLIS